ncbi:MAG: NAD(P)-dependent oxidoreductase [Chloroflexota bacterium]
MKVAVTGGAGGVGRAVVVDLLDHGHEVRSVDRVQPSAPRGCPFVRADLTDLGQVYGVLAGMDAVVHLGAIPDPYGDPNEVVFGNNTQSTFNVVEAAATLGLSRVVAASSICALGMVNATRPWSPAYVPVDEEHVLLPQDPYGLSKLVGEEICKAASRRTGIVTVSLRFTWVVHEEHYAGAFPMSPQDLARSPELWTYVDLRDAVAAVRLALTAPLAGHEAFYTVAADTMAADQPTADLLRRFHPALPDEGVRTLQGFSAPFTTAKAARLLGWQPAHSWRSR